ncbi:hypothetical protein NDU88_004222 [Pleurodeles waltl]|uniref:Uncharacterized protein n=1 Tax=Pleurodeles waltl TaxID=8319 RepID=A0AAV7KYU2_PLEWA|nr:hypothetical protein NDU88_004222 [Pleurodeles waltl]
MLPPTGPPGSSGARYQNSVVPWGPPMVKGQARLVGKGISSSWASSWTARGAYCHLHRESPPCSYRGAMPAPARDVVSSCAPMLLSHSPDLSHFPGADGSALVGLPRIQKLWRAPGRLTRPWAILHDHPSLLRSTRGTVGRISTCHRGSSSVDGSQSVSHDRGRCLPVTHLTSEASRPQGENAGRGCTCSNGPRCLSGPLADWCREASFFPAPPHMQYAECSRGIPSG